MNPRLISELGLALPSSFSSSHSRYRYPPLRLERPNLHSTSVLPRSLRPTGGCTSTRSGHGEDHSPATASRQGILRNRNFKYAVPMPQRRSWCYWETFLTRRPAPISMTRCKNSGKSWTLDDELLRRGLDVVSRSQIAAALTHSLWHHLNLV
ncbi:hypothetical protein F5148DRAFT_1211886 [Russula earlei]|uniref:Uncharacterized protein n=1 Tax=Russula earlei TaxID=71964 RepID=A0ACC0U643_9AGAM|nr:hypothetical protein F5148DRAFT_1211886 [Russula earlei]